MADTQANFLSDDDVAILRRLIEGEKSRVLNPRLPRLPDPPRNGMSTYVALPLTEIPALEELPGGTGNYEKGDADIPGSALCELYRLIPNDGLYSAGGRIVRVHNLSRSIIPIDWIQVHQDRFGVWWAITGGEAAGCDEVYFVIVDDGTGTGSSDMFGTGFSPGTIIGQIVDIPCDCSSIPGVVEGGYIELQTMPCLSLFVGAYGWAKYVHPYDSTGTGEGTGTGQSDCYWRIHSLCCEE